MNKKEVEKICINIIRSKLSHIKKRDNEKEDKIIEKYFDNINKQFTTIFNTKDAINNNLQKLIEDHEYLKKGQEKSRENQEELGNLINTNYELIDNLDKKINLLNSGQGELSKLISSNHELINTLINEFKKRRK